ncbi:MAG: hypothetical protein SGPRY_003373 [Prymnesium sp.]
MSDQPLGASPLGAVGQRSVRQPPLAKRLVAHSAATQQVRAPPPSCRLARRLLLAAAVAAACVVCGVAVRGVA